ncbi:hypothetical protein N657DRAFT_646627 [Parathielavia appendiculata]|uniref:Uncharacterized protein n=1 Tax=Parathielavia appendiculata TaxID=2587402 RepID=A0AAN6Z275_9PEZI|nr:hypothetical protein N657DRAFT_646627 [Parathielavia appendiculata]
MLVSISSCLASAPLPGPDAALLDIDMHGLWHTFWHGAINTAPDSPKLDWLALHIIQAREQGVVLIQGFKPDDASGERDRDRNNEPQAAVTFDGSLIWTDLPFLVPDMTAHWINESAAMSSAQRLSGAQFLAQLAAAGAAADDALCGIALEVLREALETRRSLGPLIATDQDSARQLRRLSVADLLPAANAWLFTAGRKLVQLSDAEREDRFPVEVGRLGELIVSSDAAPSGRITGEAPRHGGFSPQRWTWWLHRLDEINSLAAGDVRKDEMGHGSEGLGSLVRGMMNNMLLVAEQTNGPVREAVQRSNRLVSHRSPMQLLGPDRPAVSGTGSDGSS